MTREELFAKAKEMEIPFNGTIKNVELEALIQEKIDAESGINELREQATDLGIAFAKNATQEWLNQKIEEAIEENELDENGEYFTAVGQDCFIFFDVFKVGVPYRLDEWMASDRFKEKFEAQIEQKTLKMIQHNED